jgi:hypothetical protein
VCVWNITLHFLQQSLEIARQDLFNHIQDARHQPFFSHPTQSVACDSTY